MSQRNILTLQAVHQYDPEETEGIRIVPLPWTATCLSRLGALIRSVPQGALISLLPPQAPESNTPQWLDFAVQFDDSTLIQATQWPTGKPSAPLPAVLSTRAKRAWVWEITTLPTSDVVKTGECRVVPVLPPNSEGFHDSWMDGNATHAATVCNLPWGGITPAQVHGIVRLNTPLLQNNVNPARIRIEIPAATYTPIFQLRILSDTTSSDVQCHLIDNRTTPPAEIQFTSLRDNLLEAGHSQPVSLSRNRPPSFSVAISTAVGTSSQTRKTFPLSNPKLDQLHYPVLFTIAAKDLH